MQKKKEPNRKKAGKVVRGFQVLEDECIWMKAGVVNYRKCDNDFDCNGCPFDIAMRKAMGTGEGTDGAKQTPGWAAHLQRNYHGSNLNNFLH